MRKQPTPKPIRVFYSGLSQRFYATRVYRIDEKGRVTVTGEKFDVTNDIAELIERHGLTFTPAKTRVLDEPTPEPKEPRK